MGYKTKVYEHMATVNKWDLKLVEAYIGACFQEHKERSKIKWTLNIRILTEKFGVDKDLITENLRTKKSIKPTWKKKKKKKTVTKKKTTARNIPKKK